METLGCIKSEYIARSKKQQQETAGSHGDVFWCINLGHIRRTLSAWLSSSADSVGITWLPEHFLAMEYSSAKCADLIPNHFILAGSSGGTGASTNATAGRRAARPH